MADAVGRAPVAPPIPTGGPSFRRCRPRLDGGRQRGDAERPRQVHVRRWNELDHAAERARHHHHRIRAQGHAAGPGVGGDAVARGRPRLAHRRRRTDLAAELERRDGFPGSWMSRSPISSMDAQWGRRRCAANRRRRRVVGARAGAHEARPDGGVLHRSRTDGSSEMARPCCAPWTVVRPGPRADSLSTRRKGSRCVRRRSAQRVLGRPASAVGDPAGHGSPPRAG